MSSSAGSAAVRHRAAVLKAYRDFVDVARRSRPVAERQAKLDEVRTAIRANAGETDESGDWTCSKNSSDASDSSASSPRRRAADGTPARPEAS